MISRTGSYFDRRNSTDPHYIITGHTNDLFCIGGRLMNVEEALAQQLKEKEGYDAVIFLDGVKMLRCFDEESMRILRTGRKGPAKAGRNADAAAIAASGPFGNRRPAPEQRQEENLTMNLISVPAAWNQVISLLRDSKHKIALVISNISTIQHSMQIAEMAMLEELRSVSESSIVIYLFRDTTISNVLESANHGTGEWATFVETALRPRIISKDPEKNRVISIPTPGAAEICDYLRRGEIAVNMEDLLPLSEAFAAYCARRNTSLFELRRALDIYHKRHGDTLSMDNWNAYVGEPGYLSPQAQLDRMIGLTKVKEEIARWAAAQGSGKATGNGRFEPAVQEKNAGFLINTILKGNPGTGKSALAMILGQMYYELGLLPQGHVLMKHSSDLVSAYVGETAIKVRQLVEEAMGGVLFIDEAYALSKNRHGEDAIDELTGLMSAFEGQFAVILAGYEKDMDIFLEANDGLRSRFATQYVLPDYTATELMEIFHLMRGDIPVNDQLSERLPEFFEAFAGSRTKGWGNAREVSSLLMKLKRNASFRMGGDGRLMLTEEDVPEELRYCLQRHTSNLSDAVMDIRQMIGLTNVKNFLVGRINDLNLGQVARRPGNYIFMGPPGTGKTTVAHKFAHILGLIGIIPRKIHNVVEVKAAELLSGSRCLEDAVADARGGCLFIDEFHQLADSAEGRAIIRALVPMVEDPVITADTCFIIAGYAAEMRRALTVDQGLDSRFPAKNRILFDDYTAQELTEILRSMAEDAGNTCSEAYLRRSLTALDAYLQKRPHNFGNGRFIREVFLPESVEKRTKRLCRAAGVPEGDVISLERAEGLAEDMKRTFEGEDIPERFVSLAGPSDAPWKKVRTVDELLDEMVGKDQIRAFIEEKTSMEAHLFEDETGDTGLHFALAGNVGTGKEYTVRLAARVWRERGIIRRDDVIFASKASLEAGYVGQTAIKTREVIEEARGGILCIVNPSSMVSSDGHSFGPEALGCILSAMGEGDPVISFIDSKEGMQLLLSVYPGLRSQLTSFTLEDFTADELERLFQMKAGSFYRMPGIDFSFQYRTMKSKPDFANGDEVEKFLEHLRREWKKGRRKIHEERVDGYIRRQRIIEPAMLPYKEVKEENKEVSVSIDQLNMERNPAWTEDSLAESVVFLEMYDGEKSVGSGTGTIISSDGYILTNHHVADCEYRMRARVYTPGAAGGDYRWFDVKKCQPMVKSCDMALLKMEGTNFRNVCLRSPENEIRGSESTLMLGYPLGRILAGNSDPVISRFTGEVASRQKYDSVERMYISSIGLHGNSGSPVFDDLGRMMGIFSGSITMPNSLDELNFFYPIRYFFEHFVK